MVVSSKRNYTCNRLELCVFVCVSLYVCLCVRSGPLLYMVQIMILRDFTRFVVITVCVMLPLAAGLNWRFEGSDNYNDMTRTWWAFMLTFIDAGSYALICISLEAILLLQRWD